METLQTFENANSQVITSAQLPPDQDKPKVINWITVLFFLQSVLFFISGFGALGMLLYIGQISAGTSGLQYEFIKTAPYTLALPGFSFVWSLVYLWTGFSVRHGSKRAWKIGLWVVIITAALYLLLSFLLYLQIRHLYDITNL